MAGAALPGRLSEAAARIAWRLAMVSCSYAALRREGGQFILVFIIRCNDFVFAISLTSTTSAETVPAAISTFPGVSQFTVPYGDIPAAAVVVMVLGLLFQRPIVAGLTAGAVKG